MNAEHERYMNLALDLARRAEGQTRPNPPVGAIVVRRGRVVGRGYHHAAGQPHAEILALAEAGVRAQGARLYVTLEPCSSTGRTPPCVLAIRRSGVCAVVVGARDPNPRHSGRGLRWLRAQGLEVIEGVCAPQARALLAPFACWITKARPQVTLKLAQSLDGRIADIRRHSRWITGPAARREVQALRRRVDAVLVGSGTVLADDPSLLPRPARGRRPWRIILDDRGLVPESARVLSDAARQQTIMVTTARSSAARRRAWAQQGAEVWLLPARRYGVALPDLLRRLGRRGLLWVLCEGGGTLAAALIRAGLVDEFRFFLAPRILGGTSAVAAVGGSGWPLARSPRLVFDEIRSCGGDIMLIARPHKSGRRTGG
ncbi:MAG: bifunctional diaminohydroxyphosphoribosylaminopyrimidine deaminase/5-amino-6-(5-phosphoribosylamino)uracil reductase RibD [Lentisphaerae bacterium]|nr:bifunctional diaminohydroxyphosphoribosylaminopyrimidine deaminase/5-amino-6-(5-phosphoribosylamino)uracil reductase RibD [Lentisphaerota bacterium]